MKFQVYIMKNEIVHKEKEYDNIIYIQMTEKFLRLDSVENDVRTEHYVAIPKGYKVLVSKEE